MTTPNDYVFHDWLAPGETPNTSKWTSCRNCGVVRRADGRPESSCKGVVKLGVREAALAYCRARGLSTSGPEMDAYVAGWSMALAAQNDYVRVPESMTAEKLRAIADWLDTFDDMAECFVNLAYTLGTVGPSEAATEAIGVVRSKQVQDELRHWAAHIDLFMGMKQADAGDVVDLGSFAHFVNEPDDEND